MSDIGCNGEQSFGPSNFQYQQYIEQFDSSFFNFIAGLGGTLGIFLGIDVVMITEFCFSIANWIRSLITEWKSRRNKTNEEHPEAIHINESKNVVHVQPISEAQSVHEL